MTTISGFVARLDEIIALEDKTSLTLLGSYIIRATMVDFHDLYDSNTLVQTIDDHANKLEIQDGTDEQLAADWAEIKRLTEKLRISK